MLNGPKETTGRKQKPLFKLLGRLRRDAQGSLALEFAMVSMPFLLFCFSIMGYGAYFFTATSLEFRVETAARLIRTGQAQTSGLSQAAFKQKICNPGDPLNPAARIVDCSKLNVHVQSAATWAAIAPTPCLSGGSLTASGAAGAAPVSGTSGGAGQVVVVTACYEWSLAQAMPFLMLSNMTSGSSIIQAVATFRTEPYQ